MRVINDRDEKSEAAAPIGFLDIALYSLLSAIGIATVIFCPLPMIASHYRIAEPWPRVTALSGALLALILFQEPAMQVGYLFVYGLLLSDAVQKEVSLAKLATTVLLPTVALTAVGIVGYCSFQGTSPQELMTQFFTLIETQIKESPDKANLASVLELVQQVKENPRIVLMGAPLSFAAVLAFSGWLSIGMAAHFRVIPPTARYSGGNLRNLSIPMGVSVAFVVALLLRLAPLGIELSVFLNSLVLFLAAVVFIPGSIEFSRYLQGRVTDPRGRSLCYGLAVVSGLMVFLGILSPLMRRRFPVTKKFALEEVP